MKKKLLLILLAVTVTVMCVFGTVACGDDGNGEPIDENIEGTYYLSIFNGSDSAAYIYENYYIKLEDNMCECSFGWKSYPDQQPIAPFVCSYTATDETYDYSGKRIVFNINEVETTNEYIDRYRSFLKKTYVWDNGVIKCIGTATEIEVEHDELYDTFKNLTYCKKGIKPSSYARGYYSVADYGNDNYVIEPPPATPALLVDGDTIKIGTKFTYTEARFNINLILETIKINGTCKVSGNIIEFIDEDGEIFMYGKTRGRVLYTYNDKTDMSATSWSRRYYRYDTATDVDITKQFPIKVVNSAAIAELNSSN